MAGGLTEAQAVIMEAIKTEMGSGKSLKEAVNAVMRSKQFNHMTVRRVAEKVQLDRERQLAWEQCGNEKREDNSGSTEHTETGS